MTRFHALFASGIQTATNADGWTLVAPFGSYPFTAPGGDTFVQVFNAENAAEIVSAFNGIWSKLSRVVGSMFGSHACPVWKGHPDFAPEIWKEREQLGTVEGLRVGERGLEAQLALNAQGEAIRAEGLHVFPSVAVECEPEAGTKRIHPKLLWSIGLWKKPNIPQVDSIATINAVNEDNNVTSETPEDSPANDNPEPPAPMKLDPRLKALLIALGTLPADAGDDMEESALDQCAADGMTALDAYKDKAAKLADAEKAKADAEASVTSTNATHESAITALNAELVKLRTSRAEHAVQALLASGHITEAESAATLTALNSEAFDAELAKINDRAPAVNVSRLTLGKAKAGISDTASARTAINAYTAAEQAKGRPYDAAFKASREACPEAWAILDKADAAKKAAEG